MEALRLAVDPQWGVGLVLAIIRVATFVVASPITGSAWPATGRLAAVLAVSLFLAEPVPGVAELGPLLVGAAVNVAVGLSLGYLTGLLIHLFAVAGSLIDVSSGLSVAQMFDPASGAPMAVYGRLFHHAAMAFFVVIGGLQVLVRGLVGSVRLIPLDGTITLGPDLARAATELTGQVLFAGAELALPVLSSLFVAEIVLGLANRFSPQANILLLGLPVKLLITIAVVGATMLTMPDAVGGVVDEAASTMVRVVRSLAI